MEAGLEGLSAQQRADLAFFREVTADAHDVQQSIQVLQACGWNVEQALQLHWASTDEVESAAGPPLGTNAAADSLGAPLLSRGARTAEMGGVRQSTTAPEPSPQASRFPMVSWLVRGIRRIGVSFFGVVWSFIFGPGGPRLSGGPASGEAFSRALTTAYGSQLRLPEFFSGSFTQALQAARRETKLLVAYLHSDNARFSQSFCTDVLASDFVRTMLNESFLLWGGDISRMESHYVAQMVHARQFPCLCVLLPASADEIRVVGAVNGEVQLDAAVGLLTACLQEMDSHRSELVARREQQAEDRHLREQQDREYQEALEMDRKREEQQQLLEQEQRETQRAAEEQARKEREELERLEALKRELEEQRRQRAVQLGPEAADATARISLRLPAGQRIQRKFAPSAKLADVYAWAECAAFLPEHEGRGLEIPERFTLKTSFPSKELTEMESSVEEQQLSGTNILLSAIEDDDD